MIEFLVVVYCLGFASACFFNRLRNRHVEVIPAVQYEYESWNVPVDHVQSVLKAYRHCKDANSLWDFWAAVRKAIPDLPKNRALDYHISPINQTIIITDLKPMPRV